MDRSHARFVGLNYVLALLLGCGTLISASGCPALLATGVYVWEGGNMAPAECDALKGHRVVVLCKPPASNEYRNAGASRAIAARVSELLVKNVKNIDVVNPREVDKWVDESDWGDFRELAQAVHADTHRVSRVESLHERCADVLRPPAPGEKISGEDCVPDRSETLHRECRCRS